MIAIFQKAFDMLLYCIQSDVYLWLFVFVLIILLSKLIIYIFSGR